MRIIKMIGSNQGMVSASIPPDEGELDCFRELRGRDWMWQCLQMNPEYPYWSLAKEGHGRNWEDTKYYHGWEDFIGHWKGYIEIYNVIPDFYFLLTRESHLCPECQGRGYNKGTEEIGNQWSPWEEVSLLSENGKEYNALAMKYHLRQSEVDALWDNFPYEESSFHQYFKTKPTAEEVNRATRDGKFELNSWHRSICIEQRAKDEGIFGMCPTCQGETVVYALEEGRLDLYLWVLHPRKSVSTGMVVEGIREQDIPSTVEFLKHAEEENRKRFEKVRAYGTGK